MDWYSGAVVRFVASIAEVSSVVLDNLLDILAAIGC